MKKRIHNDRQLGLTNQDQDKKQTPVISTGVCFFRAIQTIKCLDFSEYFPDEAHENADLRFSPI